MDGKEKQRSTVIEQIVLQSDYLPEEEAGYDTKRSRMERKRLGQMQSEGTSHQNVTEEVLKRVTRVQPKNDHYVMPAHLQSKGRLVKKSIMRLQQRMQYEFGEEEVSPTTNQATTPPTAQLYFNEQPKVRTSRDFYEDFTTKQRKMQVVVKTKHVIAREAGRRSDGEPGLVNTE